MSDPEADARARAADLLVTSLSNGRPGPAPWRARPRLWLWLSLCALGVAGSIVATVLYAAAGRPWFALTWAVGAAVWAFSAGLWWSLLRRVGRSRGSPKTGRSPAG